ncbi:unnamed protein product [Lampetra fluviatilis]
MKMTGGCANRVHHCATTTTATAVAAAIWQQVLKLQNERTGDVEAESARRWRLPTRASAIVCILRGSSLPNRHSLQGPATSHPGSVSG